MLHVDNRQAHPYSAVSLIFATFPDGTRLYGTGALVGRNDLLTAAHVIYAPHRGGWAKDIEVLPGVDYNGLVNRLDSPPLVNLEAYDWCLDARPERAFLDESHTTMLPLETSHDLALIGLSQPIGDRLGWFSLGLGEDHPQHAWQLGYPNDGNGMMLGQAYIEKNSFYSMYQAFAYQGSDILGPGSSGGPLYFQGSQGSATLIGVRSSGNDTESRWADIAPYYPTLTEWISRNDSLLAPDVPNIILGSDGPDSLTATRSADHANGGAGLDIFKLEQPHGYYQLVFHSDGTLDLSNLTNSRDHDVVASIERLVFEDGTLALDREGSSAAGGAYRLYHSMLNRAPDKDGLRFWVAQLDAGLELQAVADHFLDSPEFVERYGATPSNEKLVRLLYLNALGREPDPPGEAFWEQSLSGGLDHSALFIFFSEGPEHQSRHAAAMSDGIWLG